MASSYKHAALLPSLQTTAEGEDVVSPPLLTRTFTKRPMWKATHSILATVHAKKFVQRCQNETKSPLLCFTQ
jgi:hypothetical protein